MCCRSMIMLLLATLPTTDAAAIDYVTGVERVCPVGAPPAVPERGVPVTDPCFGTTLVRLTDAAVEGPRSDVSFVSHGYAKFSPENADQTLALLVGPPGYMLYNVDRDSPDAYSFVRKANIPYGNGEPRWHGTDPDIVYFTDGTVLYEYSVSSDSYVLVRDFSDELPGASKIFLDEEGDSSSDSRYWAWFVVEAGAKTMALSYDKDADLFAADTDGKPGAILGTLSQTDLTTRHGTANWISVTDTGRKIVIGTEFGEWLSTSYDLDFSNGVALGVWCKHSDTAIDVDGNEVLFGYDFLGDGMTMVDLETAQKTRMLRRPWPDPNDWTGTSFGHATGTSSVQKPGWGLYSAYGRDCSTGNNFDCSLIFLMQLKDVGHQEDPNNLPLVWQIGHSYSGGCYRAQPHATINRSGTRIYFNSKWEYQSETCANGEVYETYLIELPDTWYEDLSGFTVLTTSLPDGKVGEAYTAQLRVVGGTEPYTWEMTSGDLPAGLTLAPSSGTISGTPEVSGDFQIGVTVTDAASPSQSADRDLLLRIRDDDVDKDDVDTDDVDKDDVVDNNDVDNDDVNKVNRSVAVAGCDSAAASRRPWLLLGLAWLGGWLLRTRSNRTKRQTYW